MVAVAWLTVSVSDPAAPAAVEVAVPEVPGSGPVIARPAVSPAAPLIQVFCRIKKFELRVLVIVQVTGSGTLGTGEAAALPVRVRGQAGPVAGDLRGVGAGVARAQRLREGHRATGEDRRGDLR